MSNICDKCGAKDHDEDKNSELYAHDFYWHGDIEEDYDMGEYSCLCRNCFGDIDVSGHIIKGVYYE